MRPNENKLKRRSRKSSVRSWRNRKWRKREGLGSMMKSRGGFKSREMQRLRHSRNQIQPLCVSATMPKIKFLISNVK